MARPKRGGGRNLACRHVLHAGDQCWFRSRRATMNGLRQEFEHTANAWTDVDGEGLQSSGQGGRGRGAVWRNAHDASSGEPRRNRVPPGARLRSGPGQRTRSGPAAAVAPHHETGQMSAPEDAPEPASTIPFVDGASTQIALPQRWLLDKRKHRPEGRCAS